MTITAPTSVEFKARYPEFEAVADARVAIFISESLQNVDESWCEQDIPVAILALAAHKMSLEGEPQRSITSSPVNPLTTGRKVSSRRVGDVAVQYESNMSEKMTVDSISYYDSTPYGKAYKKLLFLNKTSVEVL